MIRCVFALLYFFPLQSFAAIDGYDWRVPSTIKVYLDTVDSNSEAEGPRKCESLYEPLFNDGVLDVHYALGYFDDSTGSDHIWAGINFGPSPSYDISVFHGIRQELKAECRGRLRLCGFSESGDPESGKVVLKKEVKIQGRNVLVRVTLTHASASESFVLNKGELQARQQKLTLQSEENFFDGLKTADMVFYNGHSRNGGGPDFNPPILNKKGKADYNGYYEVRRIGIKRTYSSLKENPNQGFILGLFSCYSRKHFYSDFMKINPMQKLILTAETIDYFDTLMASMGYLEGFLRGGCGQELADTAKQGQKIKNGFVGTQLN
ncbi:MAG: hypothetical protein IPM97_01870 [Bdellovibrionaceae bacterium]|nr:hypothetical protein [Pseudobdellovibrionaceae bacterium]